MSKKLFVLKPSMVHALLPVAVKKVWTFAVASILVYGIFWLLQWIGVLAFSQSRMIIALVVISVVGASSTLKHKMIKLHCTAYIFYDTHVVEVVKILSERRQSMPYNQFQRLITKRSLYDRLLNTSDIVLQSSDGQLHGLTLKSIKDSKRVEERIYKILKSGHHEE